MSRRTTKKLETIDIDLSPVKPTAPPPPPSPAPTRRRFKFDNNNTADDYLNNIGVVKQCPKPEPEIMESYFKDVKEYQGYSMRFLVNEDYITLKHPVLLNNVDYGIEIVHITEEDERMLEKAFHRYCPKSNVLPSRLFIRHSKCAIYDKNCNVVREILDGLEYNVTIHIQGIKYKDNIITPIWRIHSAQMA